MRGGMTAIAALVLLGALWFMVRDDGGRNAAPHLFDNMNERPLADAQQGAGALHSRQAGRSA